MKILITGSLGLVGSEAVKFYIEKGCSVIGLDNDNRRHFFGEEASVAGNMIFHGHYNHFLGDAFFAEHIFAEQKPDVIIHCAGQPSHDWSAKDPLGDYKNNATLTLFLLEWTRKYCPEAVFVHCSTNKVYGDNPNTIPSLAGDYRELETRYEVISKDDETKLSNGFKENLPLDQCTHSPFGVSKLAADLYCQEYARYYGLKTGIFRMGCITGARHQGAELHGFLSYMVKCKKEKRRYKIYGYKGKQVRDNIHAFDLVNAFDCFIRSPRGGEVYNMGGSRHSNVSVLEALKRLDIKDYEYIDEPRRGDHIWYISDVSKFQSHYPEWKYKYDMEAIFEDLLSA